MSITLTEETETYALISGPFTTQKADLLAVIYRNQDGPWTIAGRVRWHKDEKVFDSEDEKRWFSGVERDPVLALSKIQKLATVWDVDFVVKMVRKKGVAPVLKAIEQCGSNIHSREIS